MTSDLRVEGNRAMIKVYWTQQHAPIMWGDPLAVRDHEVSFSDPVNAAKLYRVLIQNSVCSGIGILTIPGSESVEIAFWMMVNLDDGQ